MASEIHIYCEGHKLLHEGFSRFFAELREHCVLRVIPSGSGAETCKRFATAVRANRSFWNILLIDSEGPDSGNLSESLCQKQSWNKDHQDSIFWMVQMMESWFHADKEALLAFYGDGFKRNALKANPRVEEISKTDLRSGLSNATKDTQKGDYFDNKTLHGPKLLSQVDPEKVRSAAPNCKRLFEVVLKKLSESHG